MYCVFFLSKYTLFMFHWGGDGVLYVERRNISDFQKLGKCYFNLFGVIYDCPFYGGDQKIFLRDVRCCGLLGWFEDFFDLLCISLYYDRILKYTFNLLSNPSLE